MIDPDVRAVLDGTPIAHIATVAPDGTPHNVPVWIGVHDERIVVLTGAGSRKAQNLRADPRLALSMTAPDNPFLPVLVRGRVVEWLDGDPAWQIIDELSRKYVGAPYSREHERIVAVVEPQWQKVGLA